ncbi:MAG: hypothetical protein V3W36_04645 [Acidimicrobiia bacterium]|jgi:hypothetical protein
MSQAVQVAVAVAMGLGILFLGRWGIRLLATPAPEEVDPDDVIDVEALFICTVCGLRLTVTHAQGEDVDAPRHCREEMEPATVGD